MKPVKEKKLQIGQSYENAWQTYEQALKNETLVSWDYVILTASNEDQAKAFEAQLRVRFENGFLPKQTVYAVLPDPDGKRVGSGGATFHVLKYIREQSNSADCFGRKRILVIHSGGDSKRVPQYSVCGKLFSPVPRELPDGRRSTLFDEFMIGMSAVPSKFPEGMLILSGDVLLLFDPKQIDFPVEGAAALSMKEAVETGKNHGVFLGDANGYVRRFLHKLSVEELMEAGAVDTAGDVDIDTGAILMDCSLLKALFGLISTDGKNDPVKFEQFVNERARISFYGDFLYPLASEASLEQYLKEKPEGSFCGELEECRKILWETLSPFSLKCACLSPAQFIHFGTTRELLQLVTKGAEDYDFLKWKSKVSSADESESSGACSNSFIEKGVSVAAASYIEDSVLLGETKVAEGCIVSGVTLKDQYVPAGVAMHGLKLQNGKFVVRIYGTTDNPKGSMKDDAPFLGTAMKKLPELLGLSKAELWGEEVSDLWSARLYPVCDTMEEAVAESLKLAEVLAGREKVSENYRQRDRMSLYESFHAADTSEMLAWQEKLKRKVQAAESRKND